MVQHELALPAIHACPDNDRMPTPLLICLDLTDTHQRLNTAATVGAALRPPAKAKAIDQSLPG